MTWGTDQVGKLVLAISAISWLLIAIGCWSGRGIYHAGAFVIALVAVVVATRNLWEFRSSAHE